MASVKRRSDGVWRARYRDESGKEHARHFPTKNAGQIWLDEVTAATLTGTYVDPNRARATLAHFYADWSQRQLWATSTQRSMAIAIRSAPFVDVELGKLRRSHLEAWVKTMSVSGLAASTIRTRFASVRSVIRAAKRDRLLAFDPTEGVPLPRTRRAEHAMTIPTPDEVGALLEAAERWYRPYVALAAFAGLRLGELAGVQLGDIDFLRQRIHVQRQSQHLGGAVPEITPPKHGSERYVPLPQELGELLAQHVENVGTYGDERWLFVGGNGYPPHQRTASNWWHATRDRAGLSGVRLHDLRHFYASGLIAAGCDVVTVQRAMGHAKASTTLSTYSHLWPNDEDRTRAAAGDMMRSALQRPADSLRTETAK